MTNWRRIMNVMRVAMPGIAVLFAHTDVAAQSRPCTPYRVNISYLIVSMEPRPDSVFVDVLETGDLACINREQPIGGGQWGHLVFKARSPGERVPLEGWVPMVFLTLVPTSGAPAAQSRPATPTSSSAPTSVPPIEARDFATPEDVLRFDQRVSFGPVPVQGRSIKELADSVPMFPPIGGVDKPLWEKNCTSCHQWDRQALCRQGEAYLSNLQDALRRPHPFGGAFKIALMRWSKNGCQ